MTSIVVDHLHQLFLETPAVGMAYFFCDFSQRGTITVKTLIACLLRQLVQNMRRIPEAVRDLFAQHRQHKILPQLQDMVRCLNLVTSELSHVYIVIDALDECEEEIRNHLLSQIFDLQSNSPLSFFATSRFVPDISSQFEQCLYLEIQAHADDVKSYISGQIVNLRPFVRRDASLQELIIQSIAEAIDGMFLLARLYIDSLKTAPSVKSIKSALQNLPTGSRAYNDAYDAAMTRINSQALDFQSLAKQALSWLTCARERLTLTQVQHALGVEIGSFALDKENLPDIECLISACAGLVAFDEHSHVIRLVHYTTKQYFEQTWTRWFPNAHAEIAQICITYLSFDVFETGSCQTQDDFDIRLGDNPLYEYAAFSWDYHARLQPAEGNLLCNFLEDGPKVSACLQVLMTVYSECEADEVSKRNTGLHLAAYLGFIPAVEMLLADFDPNIENDWEQTPLTLAMEEGHEDAVKLLRAHGAGSDPKDDESKTPLHYAVKTGDMKMVKYLLNDGADPDVVNNEGETPLHYAVKTGDMKMVKYLLNDGADPDVVNNEGERPFFWAARRGHVEICKLLLQRRCVLQIVSQSYVCNCLQSAARDGNTRIVQLLLDAGVDPTYSEPANEWDGGIDAAPLSLAAKNGHEAVVMALLDRTTDCDNAQQVGQMALIQAAKNEQEKIVKLLIQRGIDPDSKKPWGITPLLIYVSRNRPETVKTLLENAANPSVGISCRELDPRSSNPSIIVSSGLSENLGLIREARTFENKGIDMTPLSLAATRGYRNISKHLLFYTASTGWEEQEQLLWACYEGYDILVEILLDQGVHADCRDDAGRTPLSIASEHGHDTIARRLLENDAIPGSKDIIGQTPLSYALENGHKELAYLLSEKDPSLLSFRDLFGRSPLLLSSGIYDHLVTNLIVDAACEDRSSSEVASRELALVEETISGMDPELLRQIGGKCLLWAVRNDHRHVVNHLLLIGVDTNFKDSLGTTPLAAAAKENNEALAKSLLDSGANPNRADRIGRTPLSWALFRQNYRLILLMLDYEVDLCTRIANPWGKLSHSQYVRIFEFKDWGIRNAPLELAAFGSSADIIAAFLKYAVWSPEDLEAALLQAVRTRKIATVEVLLDRMADEHIVHGPLREAILDKHEDIVKVLLFKGLGQDHVLCDNSIRLMFTATSNGFEEVVKFMLDKGADCNSRLTNELQRWKEDRIRFVRTAFCRTENATPLLIAADKGHEAVIKLLLEYGADPSLKDDNGDYSLRAAFKNRHHNVVKILMEKGL
ncbi:Ankyrin repeat protein, partial [Aspergillus sp. HF37]